MDLSSTRSRGKTKTYIGWMDGLRDYLGCGGKEWRSAQREIAAVVVYENKIWRGKWLLAIVGFELNERSWNWLNNKLLKFPWKYLENYIIIWMIIQKKIPKNKIFKYMEFSADFMRHLYSCFHFSNFTQKNPWYYPSMEGKSMHGWLREKLKYWGDRIGKDLAKRGTQSICANAQK